LKKILLLALAVLIVQPVSATDVDASPKRLSVIKSKLGLHERKNRNTIKKLVKVDPSTTPWCGAAVGYALRATGKKPPKNPNKAFNYLSYGKKVSGIKNAKKGDIIVYKFSHVSIYDKPVGKHSHVACGGNQSNQFKCSTYKNSKIKSVRR